ncbi:protein LYRIC-like isoform X2 [Thalassophryne amazonica]|uniref:protein LYRIC-like isoform X2 n=1 Tax=Thalassophryne amazonica TaxID=390379 RepID=UPI00147153B4|nr:protein LYRIC-like isoform X2 [Thalassophryne amazonica]
MEQWQDAASRHVKLLTDRLNELLSRGLGVDLGLKPELLPPWLSLLAAGAGLLLMLALWASVCRGLFKKRPALRPLDDGVDTKRAVTKPVKAEEQRKKKKKSEKKGQPNGRAVAEPQEEAVVPEEAVPHQQAARGKVESEVKKSKKAAKQAVKETKTVTADGKEPEEGTWETKVSNKEKREQRKKDKSSSDGSASPRGGDTPVCTTPEQTKPSAAPPPANQKKKKGETTKVKLEKTDPAASQGKLSSGGVAAVTAPVAEKGVNVASHTVGPKRARWTTSQEPTSLWVAELDGSWTVIDNSMKPSDLKLASFAGLLAAADEPQPVRDLPWLSQPRVDDEWSGLNGGSVDPSSDWNAPSEAWGNYEEPTPEAPPTQEQPIPEANKVNLSDAAVDDEDEKDKAGTAADGAAKAKKKKKKKKKAAEDGEASTQVEEPKKEMIPAASVKRLPPVQENVAAVQPVKSASVEVKVERSVKDNISQKPPITQVPQKTSDGESTAKQTGLPAPTQQKKPDESQAPKPAKKKKARRET